MPLAKIIILFAVCPSTSYFTMILGEGYALVSIVIRGGDWILNGKELYHDKEPWKGNGPVCRPFVDKQHGLLVCRGAGGTWFWRTRPGLDYIPCASSCRLEASVLAEEKLRSTRLARDTRKMST